MAVSKYDILLLTVSFLLFYIDFTTEIFKVNPNIDNHLT
ncbi:hypothetical protein ASZ90_005535 [hydrocarbon metagenome]|uniref:Uncharacterized protein n=1 Tax=hydrocarbon metagenome TaxID=938273 RepID=A0A0W8FUN9_9ZZZZ